MCEDGAYLLLKGTSVEKQEDKPKAGIENGIGGRLSRQKREFGAMTGADVEALRGCYETGTRKGGESEP